MKRALIAMLLVACGADNARREIGLPEEEIAVSWDQSPQAVIFDARMSGGETSSVNHFLRHMSMLRIFGDGRMVGVVLRGAAKETRLSEAELKALLLEIENSGFQSWKEMVVDPRYIDSALREISVRMNGVDKSVYALGPSTRAFEALWKRAEAFFDHESTPYAPSSGELFVLDDNWSPSPVAQWPPGLGVSLPALVGTKSLSGPVFDYLWQETIAGRWRHEEGGIIYSVAVRVPELAAMRD